MKEHKYTAWIEFSRSIFNRQHLKIYDQRNRSKPTYIGLKGRRFYYGFETAEQRNRFIKELELGLKKSLYAFEKIID